MRIVCNPGIMRFYQSLTGDVINGLQFHVTVTVTIHSTNDSHKRVSSKLTVTITIA